MSSGYPLEAVSNDNPRQMIAHLLGEQNPAYEVAF